MHVKVTLTLIAATLIVTGCSNHSQPITSNKSPATDHSNSVGTPDLAGNGTGAGNSSGFPVSETPLDNQSVNGCDPHSVYGPFCISTVPVWTQSSAGLTEWSQIEVGATVDVKGATTVNAKTGKPDYAAVDIAGPAGFQQMLPVASNGGFDKEVTFPSEGTYQIGVGNEVKKQMGLWFQVYYVPHPETSTNLTKMFPDSRRTLPHDIVLVFPYGTNPTVPVEFTNADGSPASDVTLQGTPNGTIVTTNAKGIAEVPLSTGKPFLGINRIYGALFSLPYLTGQVSNGMVTVWPKEMQTIGLKPSPPKIVQGGVPYYEIGSALFLLDPVAFYRAFPGDEWSRYDPKTGALTLQPNSTAQQVTVTPDGVVKISDPVAHVHPIVHNGKLYLSVPDLVKLLNTFAWASLSPTGTLRVADFLYP